MSIMHMTRCSLVTGVAAWALFAHSCPLQAQDLLKIVLSKNPT
jgi:hypothetical protein